MVTFLTKCREDIEIKIKNMRSLSDSKVFPLCFCTLTLGKMKDNIKLLNFLEGS